MTLSAPIWTKQAVLDNLVKELNDIFCTGKKQLAETKGDIHDEYLGLTINLAVDTIWTIPTRKAKLNLLCMIILKTLSPAHHLIWGV